MAAKKKPSKKQEKPYEGRGSKAYSRKIHFKLSKKMYAEFKKQGLKYTWNDAQKFSSLYLFDEYKNDYVSKIDLSEIQGTASRVSKEDFDNALKIRFRKRKPGQVPPSIAPVSGYTPTIEREEDAFSVWKVPEGDIVAIEWYDISNILKYLPRNLYIRINGGSEFGMTDIDKVENLDYYSSGISTIISNIREYVKNNSGPMWDGYRKLKPGYEDNGKNISYFIDFIIQIEGVVIADDTIEQVVEPLDQDEAEQRVARIKEGEAKRKDKSEEKEKSKKTREKVEAAKSRTRGKQKPEEKELPKQDIAKMLELLRKDFDDGLFTKEEYKIERAKLIDKLESGGEI